MKEVNANFLKRYKWFVYQKHLIRFFLLNSPFQKRRREKNKQSRGQKSCLSARSGWWTNKLLNLKTGKGGGRLNHNIYVIVEKSREKIKRKE